MASGFWTLEDGRVFAKRFSLMTDMLERITDELKKIEGAEAFYEYLEKYVYREEKGDTYNGYGGIIRQEEHIMLSFDLRTFAPMNRAFFWEATQKAMTVLKTNNNTRNDDVVLHLNTLLDMHKRITRGENPILLNHMKDIAPEPPIKLGPGW